MEQQQKSGTNKKIKQRRPQEYDGNSIEWEK